MAVTPGVTQPQSVAATPQVTQSQPAAETSGVSTSQLVAGTSKGSITTQSVTLLPLLHFSPEGALNEAQPEASKSADQATAERVSQKVAAQDSWTIEEDTPGLELDSQGEAKGLSEAKHR